MMLNDCYFKPHYFYMISSTEYRRVIPFSEVNEIVK